MYPNTFLRSLWRPEVRDQVFVAMSFEARFDERYHAIIKPAIEAEPISGATLKAYRVDNSKTGDSILSEIVDGVAHSRIVLADVSVIDEGRFTGAAVRNGNVMYEVGLAVACRVPSEVLLLRDDSKTFLFDVSTIPHLTIDVSDRDLAIKRIRGAIADRLLESRLLEDARVRMAAYALTKDEVRVLKRLAQIAPEEALDLFDPAPSHGTFPEEFGLNALMSKGCIKSVAIKTGSGALLYSLTPFGYALAEFVEATLKTV
jgi:hypothetical protein